MGFMNVRVKTESLDTVFRSGKRGFPPVFQSHRRKTDATKERNKILIAMEDGKFFHATEARKHTLKELLERMKRDIKRRLQRRSKPLKFAGGKNNWAPVACLISPPF